MRKTYFIVLILLIVVLCSCQDPIQEPNNSWQDESILGEKIVREECEKIMSLVSTMNMTSDMRAKIGFIDLISQYSQDNPFVELVVKGYGDYICGYLNKETIRKINNLDKIPSLLDYMYMNGVDSILQRYQTIKRLDFGREELVLEDDPIYLYHHKENEVLYETENLRLVGVWKELLLEDKDGREFKILLNVSGSVNDNLYVVSDVFDYSPNDNKKIFEVRDKFLITEFVMKESYVQFELYDCVMLRVDTFNGIEGFYQEYYVFKEQIFDEDVLPYLTENIEINNLLESVLFKKEYFEDLSEYINQKKYEVEIWRYWIDYSKLKNIYNF